MDIVYSERHALRDAKTELSGGELVPPFECPRRADIILARCRERQLGGVIAPPLPADALAPALPAAVHDDDYVQFIATCWADWQAAGYRGEAIATCWPSRAMPGQGIPQEIDGKIGYYALAGETAISGGTYDAAIAAAACAAHAAELLAENSGGAKDAEGAQGIFALCRPPGHHASTNMFGGYCFFNNAAIAAQHLLQRGARRVAILDVDFHHGNGTQEIFYHRDDVLFLSLHGDPAYAFPYFLGNANERGAGAGEGYTVNYPLPPATAFAAWSDALQRALAQIADYAPDYLVVSLGVDTYKADPISFFKLESEDFHTYGGAIAALNLPTAFIMEGGYAIEEVGINTVNVLEGFSERRG